MNTNYEAIRESNIERNKQFLSTIGLSSEIKLTALKETSKGKRTNKRPVSAISGPTRRSLRIAEIPPPSYKEHNVPSDRANVPRLEEVNESISRYTLNDEVDGEWVESDNIKANPPKAQPIDTTSCRAKRANLDVFLSKNMGTPIDVTGKAAVMSLANHGSVPKFSKYSGVVQWANAYFLWVNMASKDKNKDGMYPNLFSDEGRCLSWFGGSTMKADGDLIQGLLHAGTNIADGTANDDSVSKLKIRNHTSEEPSADQPDHASRTILLFIREIGCPYACFGRLAVSKANVSVHPVRITWRLLDYEILKDSSDFQHIINLGK